MSVLVCLSAGNISVTTHPIFTIFLCVTYGHGAVLFWQRCDRLYTSGFMDDVMFDHCGACRSDTVAVSDVIASSYAGYGAADASYWLCLMHHCLVLFVCDMICSESSAETR